MAFDHIRDDLYYKQASIQGSKKIDFTVNLIWLDLLRLVGQHLMVIILLEYINLFIVMNLYHVRHFSTLVIL